MIRLLGCLVALFIVLTEQLPAQMSERNNGNYPSRDTTISAQNIDGLGPFVFGVTMGAPSGIAILGGCSFDDFGVRVSGGSWGKNWSGVQGDICYNFAQSSSLALGISVIGGEFRNKISDTQPGGQYVQQKYYGLGYDMSLAGLFLQAGLATGPGEYSNPQFTFQFGYEWRF